MRPAKRVTLVLIVVAVLLAVAGIARAATVSIHLRTNGNSGTFYGAVKSRVGVCEAGREVRLYHKFHGVVGHTITHTDGKWSISVKLDSGYYWVEVSFDRDHLSSGEDVNCPEAGSRTITFL